MRRAFAILSVLMGTLLAQAMLVAGVALLFHRDWLPAWPMPALGLLGAGSWIAMSHVIDRLVPDAQGWLIIPLKLASFATFSVCGGLALYSLATEAPLPWPIVL